MKTKKRAVFTKEDYSSGEGMLTSVWGPGMWHYLHVMSFNYPVQPTLEEKHHYLNFIVSLKYTLPCKYCRMNLKKNLKHLPITINKTMKSRESFSRYVYDLHEVVNKMLHKKSNLTYDEVRDRYEHFRSRCTLGDEKPKKEEKKTRKITKETGCTVPLYGKKSKCVLKIIPHDQKEISLQIDKKCIKRRVSLKRKTT